MEHNELLKLMDSYGIKYEIGAPADEVEESINAMRTSFVKDGLLPSEETMSFSLKPDSKQKGITSKTFDISMTVCGEDYFKTESLPKCA